MNKKNRIQVIIPAKLREAYLDEVEKTNLGESGLAKHIIIKHFKAIQTPTIKTEK